MCFTSALMVGSIKCMPWKLLMQLLHLFQRLISVVEIIQAFGRQILFIFNSYVAITLFCEPFKFAVFFPPAFHYDKFQTMQKSWIVQWIFTTYTAITFSRQLSYACVFCLDLWSFLWDLTARFLKCLPHPLRVILQHGPATLAKIWPAMNSSKICAD